MSQYIKLVHGDVNQPQIKVTLTDDNTGAVVNISGASCLLKFRQVGSTTLQDTMTGTILDVPNGVVVFPMSALALSGPPGDYEGEIQVTFASGAGIQTVYDVLRFRVRGDF
jgi:hypothetical protein